VDPIGLQEWDADVAKCIGAASAAAKQCVQPMAGAARDAKTAAWIAQCIGTVFTEAGLNMFDCGRKCWEAGADKWKQFTAGGWSDAYIEDQKWPKGPPKGAGKDAPTEPKDPTLPKVPDDPYVAKSKEGSCCYEYICKDLDAPSIVEIYHCDEKGKEGWRRKEKLARWSEFHSFPCGKSEPHLTRKPHVICTRTGLANEGACHPDSAGLKFSAPSEELFDIKWFKPQDKK
jgi:hypothetical protein